MNLPINTVTRQLKPPNQEVYDAVHKQNECNFEVKQFEGFQRGSPKYQDLPHPWMLDYYTRKQTHIINNEPLCQVGDKQHLKCVYST